MKFVVPICFFVLTFSITSFSQKTFRSQGSAQIKLEDSMSKKQARDEAKQKAIINAIENVLGTYVEQETNINIESGKTNFAIFANTKVKGDWIETISTDYYENTNTVKGEHGVETEIWITCKVVGKVREIIKPSLAFQIFTLNCENKSCRQTDFMNDESLYVYFKTPTNGYLSIYLLEAETVYRLLPYEQMEGTYLNAVPVTADKEYIFFSAKPENNYFQNFSYDQVDELLMYTESDVEYLKMYVVFSTKLFVKPILNEGKVVEEKYSIPKSLTVKEYLDWVTKNRIYNPDFNYDEINLSIKKY